MSGLLRTSHELVSHRMNAKGHRSRILPSNPERMVSFKLLCLVSTGSDYARPTVPVWRGHVCRYPGVWRRLPPNRDSKRSKHQKCPRRRLLASRLDLVSPGPSRDCPTMQESGTGFFADANRFFTGPNSHTRPDSRPGEFGRVTAQASVETAELARMPHALYLFNWWLSYYWSRRMDIIVLQTFY